MCKPAASAAPGPPPPPPPPPRRKTSRRRLLLLTTESFNDASDDVDNDKTAPHDDTNGRRTGGPAPSLTSTLFTLTVLVGILTGLEFGVRWILEQCQEYHPLLLIELNRHILARHLGVDVVGCASVAVIAFRNRSVIRDMIPGGIIFPTASSSSSSSSNDLRLKRSNSMPKAGYEARLFTYHPAGQHVLLFFFAYQTKNMIDSILWNDGPVFIIHHLLSGAAAWGGMYPGCAHFYAIFFMGLSEVSTAILCLLANFDDEHGVHGLGEAFPVVKIVLGAVFAVAFVICRTILWPIVTYYFMRDAKMAIDAPPDSTCPQSRGRRGWIRLFVFSCAGLTVLQILWLWQIVVTMKEEVSKLLL